MYLLETVLVIVLLGLLAAQSVRGATRTVVLACAGAAFAVVVSSVLCGQARWQMAPAYLLFIILALLLLKRSHAHAVIRSVGVVLGSLLLGVAVMLSLALPIVELPAPTGPHAVGVRSFSLIDAARNDAYFDAPDKKRELYVQVWYPATMDPADARSSVRTLWQELYRGPLDPISFFAGYLRGIPTHSYEDAPLASADAPLPVIVFSHSLGMNAEQNTLLMEHLASHGYVVVGISHSRMTVRAFSSQGQVIYPDPNRFREAFTEGAALDGEELDTRTASAEERARIVLALGERATKLNEQVAIRVADVRFVLDLIAAPAQAPPGLATLLERVDSDRVGLMGMSLGGATVIDVCKIDVRCRAGVNLDGGLFGGYQRRPLQVPFLSMVSASNQKYGEPLLLNSTSDYYEVLVEGAQHSDFSDLTFLMPLMRWGGMSGPIDAMGQVEIVNAVSTDFFDAYLRGDAKPRFALDTFPELRVTMNDQARN